MPFPPGVYRALLGLTSKEAGSTVAAYGTGTVTPVMSMVAQLRWPTTPAAVEVEVSRGSTAGVMLWNTAG